MKNSPSSVPQRPTHRQRWAVAFASGIAITVAAAFTLSLGGIATPVHAFSKQTRAAGAAIFHDKGCQHCHGVDGIGTDRGPDLLTIGKRWHKDRIERQIREGGGGMPPFGDALQPDEVKDLVDYLSAKRKSPKTSKPSASPKAASDDSGY
jgi:mono/diheme cytochrome c family protein